MWRERAWQPSVLRPSLPSSPPSAAASRYARACMSRFSEMRTKATLAHCPLSYCYLVSRDNMLLGDRVVSISRLYYFPVHLTTLFPILNLPTPSLFLGSISVHFL